MFGLLKNLLARLGPAQARDRDPPAPMLPPAAAPNPPAESQDNVTGVRLPVQAILSGLPLELQARVRQQEASNQTISVPLEAILPQLARGIVKIPFSVLRQAAPQVFSPETDGDGVQVTLPLREILSRLDPTLVLRRRVQRQLEVPEQISSPFDPQGQPRIVSDGLSAPEMPPNPPALTAPNTPLRPAGLTSPEPPAPLD